MLRSLNKSLLNPMQALLNPTKVEDQITFSKAALQKKSFTEMYFPTYLVFYSYLYLIIIDFSILKYYYHIEKTLSDITWKCTLSTSYTEIPMYTLNNGASIESYLSM